MLGDNRLGDPCKAARMPKTISLLPPQRRRRQTRRLAAARLSEI
jgi:hypothetical protein